MGPFMVAIHHHSCTLCEATCGITVTTAAGRVEDVRGDEHDVISRGYICPKATALADLHRDPDRLKRPLVRRDGQFVEVSWREAFDLVGDRLRAVRAKYGKHALGVYLGNPVVHNLGLMLFGLPLFRSLGTRNLFTATSVDQLPQMLAAYLMLGHEGLLPVPDIDRTDLFVCLGANPLVSNGSLMTAPNMRRRLRNLRALCTVGVGRLWLRYDAAGITDAGIHLLARAGRARVTSGGCSSAARGGVRSALRAREGTRHECVYGGAEEPARRVGAAVRRHGRAWRQPRAVWDVARRQRHRRLYRRR
jgi:NADH dehydrogenase/NADH:ubiquinone oxidoreductase subunit G